MLIDRAAALATKINTYQKLKNSAAEAEHFSTRAKQFETVSLLIGGLRETLTALSEAGVPVDFQASDGLGYAAKARLIKICFKSSFLAINDSSN